MKNRNHVTKKVRRSSRKVNVGMNYIGAYGASKNDKYFKPLSVLERLKNLFSRKEQ